MDKNWYEQNENNGWYAPPAVRETPQQPPEKRRRRGWLAALLCTVLLLGLIVGSSMLFGGRGSAPAIVIPGASSGDAKDDTDDFAEDFRDFFKNYYTPQDEREDCTIPAVDSFESVAVQLHPADGSELDLHQVYQKCAPSVVAVTAFIDEKHDDRYYWSTGIILTEDGYIVTNSHVVEGSCRARVTLWNDSEYDVALVGYDKRSDIAVLKINAKGLIPAEFCDTASLAVGDRVVAIGNPLGKEFRSTMTDGIISGIDRGVSYNGTTLTLLQTSAPINEGNSGGPLINMYGQVIGITNMKMSNNTGVTIEGVGFAIPSPTVKTMADSIMANGQVLGRPALGLTLGPIPDSAIAEYSLPEGLYISAVADGSDCKAKGIVPGDILTAVNGKGVTTTEEITAVIQTLKVGDTMDLTIWHSGKNGQSSQNVVTVTLVDVSDVYK